MRVSPAEFMKVGSMQSQLGSLSVAVAEIQMSIIMNQICTALKMPLENKNIAIVSKIWWSLGYGHICEVSMIMIWLMGCDIVIADLIDKKSWLESQNGK